MTNKVLTYLGFAAKSGKLSYGFEAGMTAVKTGKSFLVVFACDLSPKSRKEAEYFAGRYGVTTALLDGVDIKTLSDAVGRKCGVISVNEKGFADAVTANVLGGNAR